MNDIKQNILDKIATGQVAMRPHWQFVLLALLTVACLVFVAGVAVYVLSLVGYLMQLSGAGYVPQFGLFALAAILGTIPWRIALLAIIIVGVLHVLVKRFSFSYQKPFLYTIVGVTGLVVASSVLIAQTTAHERVAARDIPALRELYNERAENRALHFGQLAAVSENTYTLTKLDGTTVSVVTSLRTRRPAVLDMSVPMVVLGVEHEGVIAARGIRPAPDVRERLRHTAPKERSQPLIRPAAPARQ